MAFFANFSESERAVAVLSRTGGTTWQAGDRPLFQHTYTAVGTSFLLFG